jgi:hypothetical protein
MKIIFFWVLLITLTNTSSAYKKISCPSNISSQAWSWEEVFCYKLRLGETISPWNYFSNVWNIDIRLHKKPDMIFQPDTKYNRWDSPTFQSTSWLKNNYYIIYKKTSWKIIESSPSYKIIDRPYNDKTSLDNLIIRYKVYYRSYNSSTGYMYWPEYSHTETAYHAVTWCGDWVVDTEYWEQCEPWVGSKMCSTTCQIIDN